MIFHDTKLDGLYVIEPELKSDERGFFARTWCEDEFRARNLETRWVQNNISFNAKCGTLRGLHFQDEPFPETKLVRCTMGAVWDVAVDLRLDSPTFNQWHAVELSAQNRLMFYIPTGFAHGFQTLGDSSEVFYQMSEFFHPDCARGACWDDPAFSIEWPPQESRIISERDRQWPSWQSTACPDATPKASRDDQP